MPTEKVLGHTCPGLDKFQGAVAYGCIPEIDADGTIRGCDDHNPVKITHCPFCGTKLEEKKSE